MDSTTRTSVTDDALTMAKGMNEAVALLDTELGESKGADSPALSKQTKFLNTLRYALLNHLPSEYCDYYSNPSEEDPSAIR
jgi:hypothetical protein